MKTDSGVWWIRGECGEVGGEAQCVWIWARSQSRYGGVHVNDAG